MRGASPSSGPHPACATTPSFVTAAGPQQQRTPRPSPGDGGRPTGSGGGGIIITHFHDDELLGIDPSPTTTSLPEAPPHLSS